jgi:hypothetical protein
MSNDDRHGWPAGPVNQFGTPTGQLGAPSGQFGTPTSQVGGTPPPDEAPGPNARHGGSLTGSLGGPVNQFGSATTFGASGPQQWSPPAKRRSAAPWLASVTALVVVAAAVVLGRIYVFPDLGKPIPLPATVAGISSTSAGVGQPVTVQSKDAEGRATAVSFYADDAVAPTSMVVVTAGRVKNFNTQQISGGSTAIGKVTCTDNMATASLLAQAGTAAGPAAAALSRMTTGAACWRTGRHLTVLVVAFTAHEAAQSTARQAVTDAWNAI